MIEPGDKLNAVDFCARFPYFGQHAPWRVRYPTPEMMSLRALRGLWYGYVYVILRFGSNEQASGDGWHQREVGHTELGVVGDYPEVRA